MTKVRALVGAGKIGVSSVPFGGKRISMQRHDALVDVQLGHPLGGVGEVAQDRREPLRQEVAVGVVAGVVDRPLRLRGGAGEVEDQLCRARSSVSVIRWACSLRRVDAVVLGVVLPRRSARRGSWPASRAGTSRWCGEDRVEARLDRRRAPYRSNSSASRRAPIRQAEHSASRSAARASGIRRVAGHDPQRGLVRARPASHSLIGGTIRPSSNTLVARARHRAGHGAADVVVVAERLHERDDLARPHRRTPARSRTGRAGARCRPRTGRRRCGRTRRPGRIVVEREVADDGVHERASTSGR